jgi:hypothetical protein
VTFVIVTTEPKHIRELAENLRDQDRDEIAAFGMTPHKALWRSYRQAMMSRTALVDDEVAAMWGVSGCPFGKVGRIWLLTSPVSERVKSAFVREGKAEVSEMLAIYDELRGYVDARYHRAIRLLDVLGFGVGHEFPFGPFGAPFRQFTIRRH